MAKSHTFKRYDETAQKADLEAQEKLQKLIEPHLKKEFDVTSKVLDARLRGDRIAKNVISKLPLDTCEQTYEVFLTISPIYPQGAFWLRDEAEKLMAATRKTFDDNKFCAKFGVVQGAIIRFEISHLKNGDDVENCRPHIHAMVQVQKLPSYMKTTDIRTTWLESVFEKYYDEEVTIYARPSRQDRKEKEMDIRRFCGYLTKEFSRWWWEDYQDDEDMEKFADWYLEYKRIEYHVDTLTFLGRFKDADKKARGRPKANLDYYQKLYPDVMLWVVEGKSDREATKLRGKQSRELVEKIRKELEYEADTSEHERKLETFLVEAAERKRGGKLDDAAPIASSRKQEASPATNGSGENADTASIPRASVRKQAEMPHERAAVPVCGNIAKQPQKPTFAKTGGEETPHLPLTLDQINKELYFSRWVKNTPARR